MSGTDTGFNIENLGQTKDKHEESVVQCFTIEQVRNFKPIFCFLNGKDRDILYLIFVSRKKQKDVQEILQRSQPSLCYDIKRIRRRLRFIYYLDSVFDIFLDFLTNRSSIFTHEELEILTLMFYTSSFTQTAEIMRTSQVRVRYTYDKCVQRMEQMEQWDIYEIFSIIRENLNIIKRCYKGSDKSMSEIFLPL